MSPDIVRIVVAIIIAALIGAVAVDVILLAAILALRWPSTASVGA